MIVKTFSSSVAHPTFLNKTSFRKRPISSGGALLYFLTVKLQLTIINGNICFYPCGTMSFNTNIVIRGKLNKNTKSIWTPNNFWISQFQKKCTLTNSNLKWEKCEVKCCWRWRHGNGDWSRFKRGGKCFYHYLF